MPANPTWQQVADLAAKVDGAEPGMKGICLRGLPGWGEVIAPLTTVVNTFGGTWFDEGLDAQVDAPEFKEADQLLRRPRAQPRRGRRAAGRVRRVPQQHDPGQRRHVVRRHLGRRLARGRRTPRSRARSATSPRRWRRPRAPAGSTPGPGASRRRARRQDNAWKFVSWASGKEYEQLVGEQARLVQRARPASGPRPTTTPTTSRPPGAFAEPTKEAIEAADPNNPGVQPRPALGIQFVDIPEFTDLGTKVSPGHQRGHRRTDDRRRGPGQGPEARRGGRQRVPGK